MLEVLYDQADESDKPALLNRLLDAQRRLADADSSFYRALAAYAFAIKQVHYDKGSLLDYNDICLSEGPWPSAAYRQAAKREKWRHPARYLKNYMHTNRAASDSQNSGLHTELPAEEIDRPPQATLDTGTDVPSTEATAPTLPAIPDSQLPRNYLDTSPSE